MWRYIPLGLNLLLDVKDKWIQICIVNSCQQLYVMFTALHTRAFVTHCPEEGRDLASERVFGISPLNPLRTRHWVRVDYDIVLYRIHVPKIVYWHGDDCLLGSKDGTVIWESFGQLPATGPTIMKMAVDNHCCPHSLDPPKQTSSCSPWTSW